MKNLKLEALNPKQFRISDLGFRNFIIAWQFLTVIPIKPGIRVKQEELARSMAFFPVVGYIIGLILCGASILLSGFPEELTNAIIITILVILTGALHLDGLADTVDGLMGGRNRREVLQIMRDSRIGAEGAIAIFLLLLLKWLSLNSLDGALPYALIAMPATGRWSMTLMAYFGRYPRRSGQGKGFVEGIMMKELILSTSFTIILLVFLYSFKGLIFLLVGGVFAFSFAIYLNRRVRGITGDNLGASNELTELVFLIFVLVVKGL